MFLCAKCGDFRDSDDGCAEAPSPPYFPKFGLHPASRLLCRTTMRCGSPDRFFSGGTTGPYRPMGSGGGR